MKKKQRIPRRAICNLLQLTAAALAFGVELPGVAASEWGGPSIDGTSPPPTARRAATLRQHRHTFAVGSADAEYPVRVRVATARGREALRGLLHAPGVIGPLIDGVYTVSIRTRSGAEEQQIRVGPGTSGLLEFVVLAEQSDNKSHRA